MPISVSKRALSQYGFYGFQDITNGDCLKAGEFFDAVMGKASDASCVFMQTPVFGSDRTPAFRA